MKEADNMNFNQITTDVQDNKLPSLTNITRAKAANKFKYRPIVDSIDALQRTIIKPVKLNNFGNTVALTTSLGMTAQARA